MNEIKKKEDTADRNQWKKVIIIDTIKKNDNERKKEKRKHTI